MKFKSSQPNPNLDQVTDVSCEEVHDLLEKKESLELIDVRSKSEFTGELGHIPGAKLIVLDQLPMNLHQIPKDKDVVFICRSGARSAQASAFASENGFAKTFNLKGGMIAWNSLNFETEQ